jgi:hypothetical protein
MDDAHMFMVDETRGENLILFTATEVLLDNQGGTSIFHNADLLDNIRSVKGYRINGIEKSSRGLTVRRRGCFPDLANIGCGVGISNGATANIISQAAVRDAGYRIDYDFASDVYTVHGDQFVYRFGRKRENGKISPHYSCDMFIGGQSVLVNTVEDNMQRYTKREVGKAEAARELMSERLGFATPKATIDILNAGVLNCPVTAQDVLRAVDIWGTDARSIKGKTKQKSPAISELTPLPRVTQAEQILHADLMFIKGIPFLICVLTPLCMCLGMHLKDRSPQCLEAAIRSTISIAASRGFTPTTLNIDGEGGIGPITASLQAHGIAVNVAGPG